MISGFVEWANGERLAHACSLDQLSGRAIAVDAEHFIRKILTNDETRESLLPAIGGVPFTLETNLEEQLKLFKVANIKPLFIFHGLTPIGEQRKTQIARNTARKIDEAWELYNASNPSPDRAVATFGTCCDFDIDHIYRHVQSLFSKTGIPFLVAPYSAYAEMAYLEEASIVDSIYGDSELLMYNCNRVILDLDFKQQRFTWVSRSQCVDALVGHNPSLWVDLCLLSGSSLLPTLPQLDNDPSGPAKPPRIRAAADLMRRTGMNANAICLQHQDDPAMQELNYLENFRKAFMSIHHHIIVTYEGEIVTLNKDSAPNDVHAFIGQRLPDELYYYLSRGTIGPRVLTWRTSGQVVERPPLDGGVSITYETLVRDRIVPQRVKALSLLSQSLHRFYQHQDVTLRLFFGNAEPRKLGVTDVGNLKNLIADWNVRTNAIQSIISKVPDATAGDITLHSAVGALHSAEFAKSTITKRSEKRLRDVLEIKSNALWRYLQLQEYVTPSHELSPTGQALYNSYQSAKTKGGLSGQQFEEPILLGIELLRLQLLNRDNLFPVPPYHGQPYRGTETDQKNILLISRVACLGSLRHNAVGYSGALSRHLLGYKSVISVVRQSQRDLLDMSLCTMFLDGAIDRQLSEKDLKTCGLTLPFLKDVDCALGIAVKQYLDELSAQQDPKSQKSRDSVRQKNHTSWLPNATNVSEDLDYAFALWDALYVAVQELPAAIVTQALKKEWEEADQWLNERR